MQIKNLIELKTEKIIDNSRKNLDAPKPMIFTHKITIKESINPKSRVTNEEIQQGKTSLAEDRKLHNKTNETK